MLIRLCDFRQHFFIFLLQINGEVESLRVESVHYCGGQNKPLKPLLTRQI